MGKSALITKIYIYWDYGRTEFFPCAVAVLCATYILLLILTIVPVVVTTHFEELIFKYLYCSDIYLSNTIEITTLGTKDAHCSTPSLKLKIYFPVERKAVDRPYKNTRPK